MTTWKRGWNTHMQYVTYYDNIGQTPQASQTTLSSCIIFIKSLNNYFFLNQLTNMFCIANESARSVLSASVLNYESPKGNNSARQTSYVGQTDIVGMTDRHRTYDKRQSNTDLNSPRYFSHGMRVNTWYMKSSKGTSWKISKPYYLKACTDHAPPEGICIAGEVFPLLVSLGKIDKVRRENKAQESYVQRCD